MTFTVRPSTALARATSIWPAGTMSSRWGHRAGGRYVRSGTTRRLKGTIARGYTRRAGYYGRFGQLGETKFFDTVVAPATGASTGTIAALSLNLIPQGITESQRVGRNCTLRRMDILGRFTLPTTATVSEASDRFRLIIYLDKQTNGATAAASDILDAAIAITIDSFRNLSQESRFTILHDKVHALNSGAGSGRGTTDTLSYASHVKAFKWGKKLNAKIEFNAATGAITEIRTKNIGVLAVGSGNATITFGFTCRMRYSDV